MSWEPVTCEPATGGKLWKGKSHYEDKITTYCVATCNYTHNIILYNKRSIVIVHECRCKLTPLFGNLRISIPNLHKTYTYPPSDSLVTPSLGPSKTVVCILLVKHFKIQTLCKHLEIEGICECVLFRVLLCC